MHDVISVGVPVLAILFGILLNQQGFRDLKAELTGKIDALHSNIVNTNSRIDRIQADLQQFYRTLGEHDKAIDILERRDK